MFLKPHYLYPWSESFCLLFCSDLHKEKLDDALSRPLISQDHSGSAGDLRRLSLTREQWSSWTDAEHNKAYWHGLTAVLHPSNSDLQNRERGTCIYGNLELKKSKLELNMSLTWTLYPWAWTWTTRALEDTCCHPPSSKLGRKFKLDPQLKSLCL